MKAYQKLTAVVECLKVYEYLTGNDPAADVYFKGNNPFWALTSLVYIDYAILKLHIVFDPAEHYSISKLLRDLGNNLAFEHATPAVQLANWRRELGIQSGLYKKIKKYRNKRIAHKDVDYGYFRREFNMEELKGVIVSAHHILDQIYFIHCGGSLQLDILHSSPRSELQKIIAVLDQFRRTDLKPLFHEGRKYGLNDELPPSERNK